jgi:lysine 2,3-aminomutase
MTSRPRDTIWGSVPDRDWSDGSWQVKHRVRTLEGLEAVLRLSEDERAGVAAAESAGGFEWGITPYYLSLIDPSDPRDPVRLQCVPRSAESHAAAHDLVDPLGEDPKMPVPGLVHRYPDRALLLLTDRCSVYCRFCTRRRLVGTEERQLRADEVDRVCDYLRANPGVREVILSGGDPLVAGDRFLESVLAKLRAVPSIELLRIHTRMPVVCPQRITRALAKTLRRFQPLWVVTHFNHPYEVTPEAKASLDLLADAGVPLANQSVLLAGVNSDAAILEALSRELLKARVRPYYLHQGDLATGTGHFRAPLEAAVELVGKLRGRLGGLGIPALIVDLPGGKGKIQLAPDPVAARAGREITFHAPLGGLARYADGEAALDCSTADAVAQRYRISTGVSSSGSPSLREGVGGGGSRDTAPIISIRTKRGRP